MYNKTDSENFLDNLKLLNYLKLKQQKLSFYSLNYKFYLDSVI